MCVPEESDVFRFRAFENGQQILGAAKLAVRLDDYYHSGGPGVLAELVKTLADTCECHTLVLARDELIREHTYIGSMQLMSEIDEPARLIHMFGAFRRIRLMHLG